MNIDRAVLTLAGSMVLVSLALAWLVSPYWLLLTAFVGAIQLQASFTGWCPAALMFLARRAEKGLHFNDRLTRGKPSRVALDQNG